MDTNNRVTDELLDDLNRYLDKVVNKDDLRLYLHNFEKREQMSDSKASPLDVLRTEIVMATSWWVAEQSMITNNELNFKKLFDKNGKEQGDIPDL